MPKIIQPKRLNKNITVQSYWQIRNKLKKDKKQQPIQAYRQDEVINRFRYLKPTEQAKLFNPLKYFYKKEFKKDQQDDQYAKNFINKESTHISEFMQSVRFRVSTPFIRIKKLTFGIKSIIYNHQAIFNILLQNLQCEDAWPLIQATLKDVKSQCYNFWISQGIKKLVYKKYDQLNNQKQSIYKTFFHQTLFQRLFDTLAVFMQVNYEKIMENINEFLKIVNKYLFNHNNKYIRKFSMKSVSYILNNLSLEDNLNLIFNLIINNQIKDQSLENEIQIGELLLNRHRAVKGCLSSLQITNVVQTLKQIPKFLKNCIQQSSKSGHQQQKFSKELEKKVQTILVDYVSGILELLETKHGRTSQQNNEILFDLNECLKAFISVLEKGQFILNQLTLIKAFSQYLENCDQKKFLTHNSKHQAYINQTFSILLTFLQSSTLKFVDKYQNSNICSQNISNQVSKLLGFIFTRNPNQCSKMILSKGITHYCKKLQSQQALDLITKINKSQLSQLQTQQKKTLGQFLFMSFSKFIKTFLQNSPSNSQNDDTIINLLYTTYQVVKKIEFKEKLNLNYLNLQKNSFLNKVHQTLEVHEFILICRMITLINVEAEKDNLFQQNLFHALQGSFYKLIKPFSQSLEQLLNKDKFQNSLSLFSYTNHIKSLLKYSHHEVEWVSISFSIQNSYKESLQHIPSIRKDRQRIDQRLKIWQQLSLNRVLKMDQFVDIQEILHLNLGFLQSRNRSSRKAILSKILQLWNYKSELTSDKIFTDILERILAIDSEDIDLNNQREVKKEFVLLEQLISQLSKNDQIVQKILSIISNWIIGFVFTGFKLINQSTISFLTFILNNFQLQVMQTICPLIEYYIYRHSRQFQYDISQNQDFVLKTPKKIQNKVNSIKRKQNFYYIMKQDFKIADLNTIQWIGLQRIAQSLGHAKKFKNNQVIKKKLQNYLNSYFNQQFVRKNRVLSSYKIDSQQPNSNLILQPKTRFLSVILKLCPNTYLPPYQCLHYVSAEYFSLQSVHNIKKNRWQAIWVKNLKGSKSKEEIMQTVNTSIPLDKMSMFEQQMYAHFLWHQVIEANQQKRRSIFQHIRDRMSDIIPYFFRRILYKQMLYINEAQQYFEETRDRGLMIEQIKRRFLLQNKKTVLNMMFLLKGMIVVFKNYLRNSADLEFIILILRSLIRMVYTREVEEFEKEEEEAEQEDAVEQQEDEEEGNEEEEQMKVQQRRKGVRSPYKAHRKQLYKVLTELFTHHQLEYTQAEEILNQLTHSYLHHSVSPDSQLNKNIFSNLAYATINSVPGILILLKIISQQSFYHHLLVKFGILDLAASIIDITEEDSDKKIEDEVVIESQKKIKKKQSNPFAVRVCLEILSNVLGLRFDEENQSQKMKQQSEQNQSTLHHESFHKHISSLENLLQSINHYFLLSKNLSQTHDNTKYSNTQLQYYSNENKQNINSIQNNKNRNKNLNKKHQNENKILDDLWDILGKIVTLKSSNQTNININLGTQWESIFYSQINKIVKSKQLKEKQYHKLFKIVQISLIYFNRLQNTTFEKKLNIEQFLCKIISVLPHISQLSQRVKFTQLIHNGISMSSSKLRLIDERAIQTVKQMNSIKKNGLTIQIDYDLFFSAITKYSEDNMKIRKSQEMIDQNNRQLNLLSQQYIIYNMIPYLTSEQLSVRKAVRQALNSFLVRISLHLRQFEIETLRVYNGILRLLIEQLKKNEIENVFWSILSCIGLFMRFEARYGDKFGKGFENEVLYRRLVWKLVNINSDNSENILTFQSQNQDDFFHMITSISQGNKMKALKLLKQTCIKLKTENDYSVFKQQQKGNCLPHPLLFLLPTLEHLVLPIKHFSNQHQYNVQGNLTSTLTHISLEVYQQIIAFARQSLIKKQLKRLSTKIKFNETQRVYSDAVKKNILVIKIISSIVEGIDQLQKCTHKIRNYVEEYGFDEFHSKLILNSKKTNQDHQSEEEPQNDEEQRKKVEFGTHLQQLESQQAINRNFMMFDRKLMAMEEKENPSTNQNSSKYSLIKFLKLHVLIPFKLMLFYENKSSKEAKEEQDKSRMMLSVAITKLLIKFPMDMFLFQFQKILSKICRLLKKRKQQIRENGRKSLCQIAKIVGPQMLYAIVLELKFHLRDNFQKHIFNFTVYQIIQNLPPIKQGELDYCLPLILPMIIDEMFGQTNDEKKMVQENQVPVLNMETKKKKGHQLLILLSKQITVQRIRYMIDYLENFLKEYLNTQANVSKFQMMINYLTNGLGNNQQFTNQQNAGIFGQMLCDSMYQLRKQIKIYNFEEEKNKLTHQTTIKINTEKSKKVGKEALLLQQCVGRNGSIFKKMSKQIYQKRNKQVLINCLVQFYLALGSLLIKKQVISLKTLEESKQLTSNFIKIMQFVFECMDHRDNRIVSKSMRLLHQALIWNYQKSASLQLKDNIKSLRKKVSRKILLFIQKLTSTDQQLLKQSFVILIDLFSQVTITKQFLPSIISIIKLHTNNQKDEANIAQPYKLLKLIIYKIPSCIYDSLIYQMYEISRINIVNSNNRQIREVCRQIASTYIKNKQYLSTGIQLKSVPHEGKQKHQTNKSTNVKNKEKSIENEYTHRIRNELNFYISNLDCKIDQNQVLVLQIIEEWIRNRQKNQIEQVSELILLSLATSIINGNQNIQKISKVIDAVLTSIEKTKIYDILSKSLIWISQPRQQKAMIVQCGYFLLNAILQSKTIKLENQTVKNQYLMRNDSNSLIHNIEKLLHEEIMTLKDYLMFKKGETKKSKVQNKDWGNVLDAIQVEESNPYINQNKILGHCLNVLTFLAQNSQYQDKLKQKHIVGRVWTLLKVPQQKICLKAIQFLSKISNLSVQLQMHKHHVEEQEQQQNKGLKETQNCNLSLNFNYKSTIGSLVNNQIEKQSISSLMQKLHSQHQLGETIYLQSFNLVTNLVNKIVTKFKSMQSKVQPIYYLLNNSILNNQHKKSLIFKNQQKITKLIDTLGKVSRNQFVSLQGKTFNQQTINIVKQIVGVSEFFKKLTKLQSQRRQKKSQQKAHIARLAVTDQQAFIEIKQKKRIKKEDL